MRVLSIILGIILIIGGIACMSTPIRTFVDGGYFLAAMLLVWGIYGIITGISKKRYGFLFVFSIISTIMGFVLLFVPSFKFVADIVILIAMACWFVVRGVTAICASIKLKDISSSWGWGVFLGVLDVIVGIYSFVRPFALAIGIGIMLGIYFIISGINLIAMKYD